MLPFCSNVAYPVIETRSNTHSSFKKIILQKLRASLQNGSKCLNSDWFLLNSAPNWSQSDCRDLVAHSSVSWTRWEENKWSEEVWRTEFDTKTQAVQGIQCTNMEWGRNNHLVLWQRRREELNWTCWHGVNCVLDTSLFRDVKCWKIWQDQLVES